MTLKGRHLEAISDLIGLLVIAVGFTFLPRPVAWLIIALVGVWVAWRRLGGASANAIFTPEITTPDVMAGAEIDHLTEVVEGLKAQQEQMKSLYESLSAQAAPPMSPSVRTPAAPLTPATPPVVPDEPAPDAPAPHQPDPDSAAQPKPRLAARRRIRLRTGTQSESLPEADSASAPPPMAPMWPPTSALIPIRAQITIYQEGQPTKHLETPVRLSGRG